MPGLQLVPAIERLDLLAEPIAAALLQWSGRTAVESISVGEIDPDMADTAAFCERYGFAMSESANCVIVQLRRADVTRLVACVVLATTRADVNGFVRKRFDARKASFAPLDEATRLSGMEYGGISPIGLPGWPVLVDAAVAASPTVVLGSGLRRSKVVAPGSTLSDLAGAEIVEGLGRPIA